MSYPFDQFAAVAGANRQLALKCAEIMREAGQRQAAIASGHMRWRARTQPRFTRAARRRRRSTSAARTATGVATGSVPALAAVAGCGAHLAEVLELLGVETGAGS